MRGNTRNQGHLEMGGMGPRAQMERAALVCMKRVVSLHVKERQKGKNGRKCT